MNTSNEELERLAKIVDLDAKRMEDAAEERTMLGFVNDCEQMKLEAYQAIAQLLRSLKRPEIKGDVTMATGIEGIMTTGSGSATPFRG